MYMYMYVRKKSWGVETGNEAGPIAILHVRANIGPGLSPTCIQHAHTCTCARIARLLIMHVHVWV